jgi:predicted acylesterase/phospholipase RssA
MPSNNIHLVCSSGGLKCFSYIGAVQKLQEAGITISSVSACSMGTIIGALLCAGLPMTEVEEKILNFDFNLLKTKKSFSFFRLLSYPFATHDTPDFERIIISLLGYDMTLGELTIPFQAAALDIRQRRFLVYSSATHPGMKLSELARIATAIPFRYAPYKLGKRLLVDAALASESPVWMAANNPGRYPIVVLRPGAPAAEPDKRNPFLFMAGLFMAATGSQDYFANTQTARSVEISINTGEIDVYSFNISKEQIEKMILQGQDAAESKLREFGHDFDNILEIEETTSNKVRDYANAEDLADKAESVANQIMANYKNESIKRSQVFISYSHRDKPWLDKLKTSLKYLERFTGIKAWDDTAIAPGDEWNQEIEQALVAAKVAVFLVTPHFLASDFIQDREMRYFMEISAQEKVPILWVAVSDTLYEKTPLQALQCANNPNKPLDKLSEAEQNSELKAICQAIIHAMQAPLN